MKVDNSTKKDINKKILFAFLIFFPYGVYLLIKYKGLNKLAMIPVVLILIFVGLLTYDEITNPYSLENKLAINEASAFSDKIGFIRTADRIGEITIKDSKFHKYDVYTPNGKYLFYYGTDDGKKYITEAIFQVEPTRSLTYVSEKNKDIFSDIYPEIIEFIESNKEKYGDELKLIKTLDTLTQQVQTEKGNFRVVVNQEQVTSVIKENNSVTEFSKEPVIKLLPGIEKLKKKIEKHTGKIKYVYDYENTSDKRTQYVITDRGNYKIDFYDDGKWQIFKSTSDN